MSLSHEPICRIHTHTARAHTKHIKCACNPVVKLYTPKNHVSDLKKLSVEHARARACALKCLQDFCGSDGLGAC